MSDSDLVTLECRGDRLDGCRFGFFAKSPVIERLTNPWVRRPKSCKKFHWPEPIWIAQAIPGQLPIYDEDITDELTYEYVWQEHQGNQHRVNYAAMYRALLGSPKLSPWEIYPWDGWFWMRAFAIGSESGDWAGYLNSKRLWIHNLRGIIPDKIFNLHGTTFMLKWNQPPVIEGQEWWGISMQKQRYPMDGNTYYHQFDKSIFLRGKYFWPIKFLPAQLNWLDFKAIATAVAPLICNVAIPWPGDGGVRLQIYHQLQTYCVSVPKWVCQQTLYFAQISRYNHKVIGPLNNMPQQYWH